MKQPPRDGLEGVDRGDEPTGRWARLWRSVGLFVRDPAGWSARRYREKNDMDLAAVRPDTWRKGER